MKQQIIKLSKIVENKGQIEGLPRNPRQIKDEKYKLLKKSIEDDPEMLELRELLVYPHNNKFVVIGGNMRLKVLRELGVSECPCKVIPEETPIEKLRAYTIKDNNSFGDYDYDLLGNDWEVDELLDWGCDLPDITIEEETKEAVEDDDLSDNEYLSINEELFDKFNRKAGCMALRSIMEKYNKVGWQFISEGGALLNFINFCYSTKDYRRFNAIAFHPNIEKTANGNHKNIIDEYRLEAESESKINGYLFATSNGQQNTALYCSSQAVQGEKRVLDFPASLARHYMNKYADGGRVLDPCAGWGGRLVGFLASKAVEYVCCDPADPQINGNKRIYELFNPYTPFEKKVSFNCTPFEKYENPDNYFDMAITSPPYFDVEDYVGGAQSHKEYSNYDLWVEKFYSVLIEKTYHAIKDNGVFVLQVGNQKYPLATDAIKIAEKIGFILMSREDAGMGNNIVNTSDEDKETALVFKKYKQ